MKVHSIDIEIGVVPWPPTKNDVMLFEFSVSIDVHRLQLFQSYFLCHSDDITGTRRRGSRDQTQMLEEVDPKSDWNSDS